MGAQHLLTHRKIVTTVEPGRHHDGAGLYLLVGKAKPGRAQAKRWVFICQWGGKRTEFGLGALASVSLAEARAKANEYREAVKKGVDPRTLGEPPGPPLEPVKAPPPAVKPTFKDIADAVTENIQHDWRGRKTLPRWKLAVEGYAAPFRDKPIDEVTTGDVLAVLSPIWRTKPEISQKVRGHWERVFDAASALGLRQGQNPAQWSGHLKHLLGKIRKLSRGHHPALGWENLPAFTADLRKLGGVAPRGLEFTILTAARTTMTLEARWREVAFEDAMWSLATGRVKNMEALEAAGFEAFQIPLSPEAMAVLDLMRACHPNGKPDPDALIFPKTIGGRSHKLGNDPLSYNAMRAVLMRMGYVDDEGSPTITVHGFRSTFRVWGGKQLVPTLDNRMVRQFSSEALEFALDHVVGDEVQRAYDRGDYLSERTPMMRAWGAYACSSSTGVMMDGDLQASLSDQVAA
ncbi:MAG: integrase arm-type DNA-binding domain-containing protein [Caulobacteraceae bacterium]